jgi:hypothetical protein
VQETTSKSTNDNMQYNIYLLLRVLFYSASLIAHHSSLIEKLKILNLNLSSVIEYFNNIKYI